MRTLEKLKVHRLIAAFVLAIGAGLMSLMIATEGEPGLLPLVLVALGGGWLGYTIVRIRALRR